MPIKQVLINGQWSYILLFKVVNYNFGGVEEELFDVHLTSDAYFSLEAELTHVVLLLVNVL